MLSKDGEIKEEQRRATIRAKCKRTHDRDYSEGM